MAEHPVDALHRSCRDHSDGAAGQRLLGVLEEEANLAGEVARASGARTSATPSIIEVWPSCPQACITPGFLEAKGRPVCLLDRQRVVVGAERDPRAGAAAAQVGDDAGRGRPGDRGEAADPLQLGDDEGRGLGLLVGELGAFVQVPAPVDDAGGDLIDPRSQVGEGVGRGRVSSSPPVCGYKRQRGTALRCRLTR